MTQEIRALRTSLYRMLSFQLHSPPDGEDLKRMTACENLARSAGRADVAKRLIELIHLAQETTEETLAQDFHDLLMVPGRKYTTPYEAVYVDEPIETPSRRSARTCGPSTQAVAAFYRRIGLEIDRGYTELPDYVGLELAAMEYLCAREEDLSRGEDPEAVRKAGEFRDLLLRDHLARWVPAFADTMRGRAETEYFRKLAEFTRFWILEDANAVVEQRHV